MMWVRGTCIAARRTQTKRYVRGNKRRRIPAPAVNPRGLAITERRVAIRIRRRVPPRRTLRYPQVADVDSGAFPAGSEGQWSRRQSFPLALLVRARFRNAAA